MPSELLFLHFEFLAANIFSAFFLFLGTVMLISFLKVFGGKKFKKYAVLIGSGMLLVSLLHEWGELICGSSIHGGFPETLYGSAHIIFLSSIGSILFFIGCYMFQRKYSEYLKS